MSNKIKKVRLDLLLVDRGTCQTRERARALIMSGAVLVGETKMDKAGALVSPDAEIRIEGEDNPYVSRGGLKLKGALSAFDINVRDLVALDVALPPADSLTAFFRKGRERSMPLMSGMASWRGS